MYSPLNIRCFFTVVSCFVASAQTGCNAPMGDETADSWNESAYSSTINVLTCSQTLEAAPGYRKYVQFRITVAKSDGAFGASAGIYNAFERRSEDGGLLESDRTPRAPGSSVERGVTGPRAYQFQVSGQPWLDATASNNRVPSNLATFSGTGVGVFRHQDGRRETFRNLECTFLEKFRF